MNYDNGYRYYVCEYVLDRWIPISMHQTYHGALANVTAEHQVIRYLDKYERFFVNSKLNEILGNK